jgi:hypothetical protein
MEGRYLNQILQFGRKIDGQNVFQYNSGIIINTYFIYTRKESLIKLTTTTAKEKKEGSFTD